MENTVVIKGVTLGAGKTKIITPIVEKTNVQILARAKEIEASQADLVEWRIDHYDSVIDRTSLLELAKELRKSLTKPLLITFRTKEEGGVKELSSDEYLKLLKFIVEEELADLIDVEMSVVISHDNEMVSLASTKKIPVIMSNHNFKETPSIEEMVYRLLRMAELGADICKIAVMPENSKDVLHLLEATRLAYEQLDRPIITMSMGELGKISRMTGDLFGSCATFGALGNSSAPGQLSVEEILQISSYLSSN